MALFLDQQFDLGRIFQFYNTSLRSLKHYRMNIENSVIVDHDYIGYTKEELRESFNRHADELERNVSLTILSAMEARFRIDYMIRAKKRLKDDLSRKMRELYKAKAEAVSLEQDILILWKRECPESKKVISDYISALKYRHWLAHGRYWEPKLGRKFDVSSIGIIARQVLENLPLSQTSRAEHTSIGADSK